MQKYLSGNEANIEKHHVSFEAAKLAWLDPWRIVAEDERHSSSKEKRYLLLGRVAGRYDRLLHHEGRQRAYHRSWILPQRRGEI